VKVWTFHWRGWITSFVVASATPRCLTVRELFADQGTGIRSYEGFDPFWEMEKRQHRNQFCAARGFDADCVITFRTRDVRRRRRITIAMMTRASTSTLGTT